MEIEETGKVIDTIGIDLKRHKELINRLSELVEASGLESISTSQLIDLIAKEPTFTKKECVYLGLYLAATRKRD
jgi:hypothetical protein